LDTDQTIFKKIVYDLAAWASIIGLFLSVLDWLHKTYPHFSLIYPILSIAEHWFALCLIAAFIFAVLVVTIIFLYYCYPYKNPWGDTVGFFNEDGTTLWVNRGSYMFPELMAAGIPRDPRTPGPFIMHEIGSLPPEERAKLIQAERLATSAFAKGPMFAAPSTIQGPAKPLH
jgi:hypothetical protein